jgi:hypothetical protein
MATLEEEYKQYQQTQNTDQINSMYDAQKQAQLGALESAYNQSLSNAQAARDQIPQQYQQRANDLAVQYERQRRNLNEQAAANGLNTGAGSQMQLALGSNYQRDYGGIRRAEQAAINEADRGIRDLQSAYQSSVQQAVANNDYQRAQALLAEYKNQYQNALNQAATLASYGDFSAYLNVPGYSQEQVDAMRSAWIAGNPDMAYRTGAITPEQYYQYTGKYPAGYQAPGGGGGGWVPQSTGGGGGGSKNGLDVDKLVYQIGTARPYEATALLKQVAGSPYAGDLTEADRARLEDAFNRATKQGRYSHEYLSAANAPKTAANVMDKLANIMK